MGFFKLFSLAVAAVHLAEAQQTSTATNTAERVDCSADMNVLRTRAQLAELELGTDDTTQLPILKDDSTSPPKKVPNTEYLTKVCDAMKKSTVTESGFKPDGTFAYALQDGNTADCAAAVKYWKDAVSNFDSLPPAYTTDEAKYKDPQNVSFISMFNPAQSPKVDCAYFICPAAAADTKTAGTGSETTEDKELRALLCVTTPKVFTVNNKPFDQTQWDNISKAARSAASTAVPAFFAVAAAAFAAIFL
ncbi:SAG family member [Eimeria praecox]|uniref:SAG family member n=1 Tax=Eimeria praecox TaxID=51316 RepID=U6G3Q4_9EIME|nr:SAG family member [Eimeria praecox]